MNPRVSVVIPSWDGDRKGNVAKLLNQLQNQTWKGCEVEVVKGVSPNGKARNVGARKTRGEILIFLDDDVTLGHDRVIEGLVRALDENPNLGLVGPSMLVPENANAFQKAYARQISRNLSPVVKELTESDMVCHMGLAIRRNLYEKLGGENEEIVRGTDPDLRHRVRAAGFRVALAPDSWAFHPPPQDWKSMLKGSFWNGAGSAWVSRHHPEFAYETASNAIGQFEERRGLLFRALRFAGEIASACLRGHWVKLGYRIAYGAGWLRGLFLGKEEGKRVL